jgi:hypothetical protein
MRSIKIFSIFVVLFTAIFLVMCDNKSDLQSEKVSEQTNPYNYYGDLHNQAMKDGLKEFYNSTIKQGIDPKSVDLSKFSNDFTISFMEKEIVKRVEVSDVNALKISLQTSLDHSSRKTNTLLRSAEDNINSEIANSSMSDFQKEKIIAMMNIVELFGENIAEDLQKLEEEVLQAKVLEKEKCPVLAVLAITKSSLKYWTEHVISIPTNDKAALKADALGALGGFGGFVGGLLSGHAAVGLMFGPGGVVLTLAADVVIGAISSSLVEGVGASFGWW